MKPNLRKVLLQFDAELSRTEDGVEERGDLSVATEIGDTLWVASDETVRITRLSRQGDDACGGHAVFDTADYLSLPGKEDAEADLEGLDHAEGMTFRRSEDGKQSFLVVYDSPAASRIAKKACFIADACDI
ncbi:MAG: DUF3616 domain-containing protein [Akkermansiaceae bacterium]|nr:DUF3616 domain-containing protein [Armatimonadota bacterium]